MSRTTVLIPSDSVILGLSVTQVVALAADAELTITSLRSTQVKTLLLGIRKIFDGRARLVSRTLAMQIYSRLGFSLTGIAEKTDYAIIMEIALSFSPPPP